MVRYTLLVFESGDPSPENHQIDCAADSDAINTALDIAAGRAVELRNGDRRVLVASPMAPAGPAWARNRRSANACARPVALLPEDVGAVG